MRSLIEILFVFAGLSFLSFIILLGLQNFALIDLSDSEFWIISPAFGLLISLYHYRYAITGEGRV